MTHRSWAYENGGDHNERLEFLGDAVLGFVVTEHLYRNFTEYPEGQLAKLRSAVVNTAALANVGRDIGLGSHIRLGRGESMTGGADKDSILADTLEALIGAVLLSAGRDAAEGFVSHLFVPRIAEADKLGAGLDWKTSLQELAAAMGLSPVVYTHEASGPDHDKRFTATVTAVSTAPRRGRPLQEAGRTGRRGEGVQAAVRESAESSEPEESGEPTD